LANLIKITVNGKTFQVELLERHPGEVRFSLEGREYKVAWERELTQIGDANQTVKKAKRAPNTGQGKTEASEEGVVAATIPGIVVEILVKAGDKVDVGDALLCLEAMKMENRIYAPSKGTVEEVLVSEGQDVMDGQALVRLK